MVFFLCVLCTSLRLSNPYCFLPPVAAPAGVAGGGAGCPSMDSGNSAALLRPGWRLFICPPRSG